MRRLIATIAAVACLVFLAAGHMYWKDKTTISSSSEVSAKEADVSKKGSKESKPEQTTGEEIVTDVLKFSANWPNEAQTRLLETIEEGIPFKIAFVGSPAMGKENGWATALQEELLQTYGSGTINVQSFSYNMTSLEFMTEGHEKEVAEFQPDLVLFEPFTLKNNGGGVSKETTKENISQFIDELTKTNEQTVVIFQPPHPIYNSINYPDQINDVKEYAEAEDLTFLDHWSAWPDPNTEEIKEYLLEDQSGPNKEGHEIWFNYLKEYFIAD